MVGSSLLLAAAAGVLSTLSPCVLPLLPVVVGAAVTEHRLGPVALAIGLALSFTAIGLFVATIGFSLKLDNDVFRVASAVLLLVLGAILLVPRLQAYVTLALEPVQAVFGAQLGKAAFGGLGGQLALGLLLGAVWSPCAGPTLGAASLLAARGESLAEVGSIMLSFGAGAAVPLLLIGMVSREALIAWRGGLGQGATVGRAALGGLLIVLGGLIVTGLDRPIETALVAASPQWLTDLSTRF